MRYLLVRDVMTAGVRSVRRSTPVTDIAEILSGCKISAVPVVDGERTVVGVVSEADLLSRALPPGRWTLRRHRARCAGQVAEEVMTAPAVTVGPEDSMVEAARRMVREHVKRLPVVDRYGKLVGIVSRADLIGVFTRGDDVLRREIVRDVFTEILRLPENEAERMVTVDDGVVTLTGRLERKSFVPIAVYLTSRIPGVVAVLDRLTFVLDDVPTPPVRA